MDSRSTSSAWLRGVADALAGQGMDVPALFLEAGIDPSALDDADRRWPTETVNCLWSMAARRSGNPAIALANPQAVDPGHYGVVGYAMMSSSNLLTGLERLIRYLGLVSDAASISLVPGDGGRFVRIDLFGGSTAVPRQRSEYAMLTLLKYCRWMTGRSLRPHSVWFTYPVPEDMRPYDEAFQAPSAFEQEFNGFCVSDQDLLSKLPTAIPQLAELHDRVALAALDKLKSPRAAYKAQEAILKRLQDGEPRRADVAGDLMLSDHTFKRRLVEEGTSFSELVDATRRELAQQYLTQTNLGLMEIVYLLGYSDQSNFFRACMRWFGEPPGKYRSHANAS
ncbi:MAG: putative Transcriptional regulator, AraC/XylS family [Ramlibacter sp.]|nr:putative Transcriptional regulator, AraC/XylS family [Ramlibacter sp.]